MPDVVYEGEIVRVAPQKLTAHLAYRYTETKAACLLLVDVHYGSYLRADKLPVPSCQLDFWFALVCFTSYKPSVCSYTPCLGTLVIYIL